MQHLLSRFIWYGETVPGTMLDRVVSVGESPSKRAFNSQHVPENSVTNNDGLDDWISHLLFTDNFTKPYSHLLSVNHCTLIYYASLYFNRYTQYTLNFIYYIMPLYVLLLFILFYQVFILLHRVPFICDCTYEYVCNVSSPATEAE